MRVEKLGRSGPRASRIVYLSDDLAARQTLRKIWGQRLTGKRIDGFIKSTKPIEVWLIQGPANGAERDYGTGQP